MPSGHCAFSRRPFCVRRPTAKAEALADAGPGRGFIAPHRCRCPVHRHLRCELATTAVSRHTSPRQVLPRAKSGFAQFDLRVNDLDNPWLHSAYIKLRLGLLSLAKDFTALSGGSGGGSDIFRKDNPENSRSNPQARGGQCSGTLGGIIPPNPHFAPTFTCYLSENQHTVGLPAD